MKTVIALIVVGLLVAEISTCFVAVDACEYAIIKRFGEPVNTYLEPGLRLKYPYPIDVALRFDNRLQVFEKPGIDEPVKESLTLDKKNVEVATYTCWKIMDKPDAVLKFLETVGDRAGAETRLGDIVISRLESALGKAEFKELVSDDESDRQWDEIVTEVRDQCAARAAEDFGIEIRDFRLLRLNFPAQNRRSVFDRMRAERERIATKYRSEGEEQAMTIRAEAERDKERILAEAEAESARIRGEADAEATRIYGEAYGTDPEFYKFIRTLESYENGIDRDTVLILPVEADFFQLLIEADLYPTAEHIVPNHNKAEVAESQE